MLRENPPPDSNPQYAQLNTFCIKFRDGTRASRIRLFESTIALTPEYTPILQNYFSKLNLDYVYPAGNQTQIEIDLVQENSIFGVCRSLTQFTWFRCGEDT